MLGWDIRTLTPVSIFNLRKRGIITTPEATTLLRRYRKMCDFRYERNRGEISAEAFEGACDLIDIGAYDC